jgi:hypothetical protein
MPYAHDSLYPLSYLSLSLSIALHTLGTYFSSLPGTYFGTRRPSLPIYQTVPPQLSALIPLSLTATFPFLSTYPRTCTPRILLSRWPYTVDLGRGGVRRATGILWRSTRPVR